MIRRMFLSLLLAAVCSVASAQFPTIWNAQITNVSVEELLPNNHIITTTFWYEVPEDSHAHLQIDNDGTWQTIAEWQLPIDVDFGTGTKTKSRQTAALNVDESDTYTLRVLLFDEFLEQPNEVPTHIDTFIYTAGEEPMAGEVIMCSGESIDDNGTEKLSVTFDYSVTRDMHAQVYYWDAAENEWDQGEASYVLDAIVDGGIGTRTETVTIGLPTTVSSQPVYLVEVRVYNGRIPAEGEVEEYVATAEIDRDDAFDMGGGFDSDGGGVDDDTEINIDFTDPDDPSDDLVF